MAVVETRSGAVRGVEAGGLLEFRGIPFAAPPTGQRRWCAPEPEDTWTEVGDASGYGGSAPRPPMVIDFLPGMNVGPQAEDPTQRPTMLLGAEPGVQTEVFQAEREAWDGLL